VSASSRGSKVESGRPESRSSGSQSSGSQSSNPRPANSENTNPQNSNRKQADRWHADPNATPSGEQPAPSAAPNAEPARSRPSTSLRSERDGRALRRRREGEAPAESAEQAILAESMAGGGPSAPVTAARPAVRPPPGPRMDADALMAELDQLSEDDFAALLRAGTPNRPQQGDRIEGRVVRVGTDGIFVDLGAKAEGIIDPAEMVDELPEVGSLIQSYVLSVDERGIRLARRLTGNAARDVLDQAQETGVPIEGRVESRNSGGFTVRIGTVRAFCPVSQIDRAPEADLDAYVGRTLAFRVMEVRDRDVVVSHRAIVNEQAQEDAERLWSEIKPGDAKDGVVTGVKDFGLFVDVGGLRGLVPKREVGWDDQVEAPPVGTRVVVRVLDVDTTNRKLTLSLKDHAVGPWSRVGQDFLPGEVYEGTVVRISEFGAFVRLAPGLEGLVHLSNIAPRRISSVSEVLSVSQKVSVRILSADPERQRLELGIKQVAEDWEPAAPRGAAPAPRAKESLGTFADLLGGVKVSSPKPAPAKAAPSKTAPPAPGPKARR
jgi:small subunit ribosomal protein S1